MRVRNVLLILGDMLELGADAERHHRELGAYINTQDHVLGVIVVGGLSVQFLYPELRADLQLGAFQTPEEAIPALNKILLETKVFTVSENTLHEVTPVVLVKGSNGMGLEKVVRYLRESAVEAL